jgi:ComF family protein
MDYLKFIKLLGGLFYPVVCENCGICLVNGESYLCLHCIEKIPKTEFLLQKNNPVEKIFWGRVPFHFATSFLHFHKDGMTQHLLHNIKYKNKQDLAIYLGKMFARDILVSYPNFKPDVLVPVPLHPRKEKQRGYNQAFCLAMGLGEVLNCPVDKDFLRRNIFTNSQTLMGRYRRWENVGEVFSLNNSALPLNSKIVLIDDVITTGATAEACLKAIIAGGFAPPGYMSIALASG